MQFSSSSSSQSHRWWPNARAIHDAQSRGEREALHDDHVGFRFRVCMSLSCDLLHHPRFTVLSLQASRALQARLQKREATPQKLSEAFYFALESVGKSDGLLKLLSSQHGCQVQGACGSSTWPALRPGLSANQMVCLLTPFRTKRPCRLLLLTITSLPFLAC